MGARAVWALVHARAGVTPFHQVPMPAQNRVGADQQPDAPERGARERGQQGGKERTVLRLELDALRAELAFKRGELVQ
jgi:hypothetical protein